MGLGRRQTALVTGAAGFLGSHLCDRLLDEGFEVIGLDNLMTGSLDNLKRASKDSRFHFIMGDVREKLPAYAELIFNFACPASPVHYQHDRWATATTCALGAIRLVEYARAQKCRIVHASTSEIYGDPTEHPQQEDYWGNVNPVGKRACYDEGKRFAETVLTDGAHLGLDVRIIRIFNTYGPRMALNDGRVVSDFCSRVLRKLPIVIHGDGQQTRSFCYVSDLIDGIMLVSRTGTLAKPINLGNPSEITVQQLAMMVMFLTKQTVELTYKTLPEDDPKRRCPDITRAQNLLRFEPKISLEDGLVQTLEDFRPRVAREDADRPTPRVG